MKKSMWQRLSMRAYFILMIVIVIAGASICSVAISTLTHRYFHSFIEVFVSAVFVSIVLGAVVIGFFEQMDIAAHHKAGRSHEHGCTGGFFCSA